MDFNYLLFILKKGVKLGELWCLMPLLTIFQLYHGHLVLLEYTKKTIDLPLVKNCFRYLKRMSPLNAASCTTTYLERQKCYGPDKKTLFKKPLFDLEVKGQGPNHGHLVLLEYTKKTIALPLV
jgi:hypothetical protein